MKIIIQKAKIEDYNSIINLYSEWMGKERFESYTEKELQDILQSDMNFMFLALNSESGHMMGLALASERKVFRYKEPIIEIDELFVSKEYRNNGVASKLIQKIIDISKEKGIENILVASGFQWKNAHKLYEKLGFEKYEYKFKKKI